jgi:hypothetical protein
MYTFGLKKPTYIFGLLGTQAEIEEETIVLSGAGAFAKRLHDDDEEVMLLIQMAIPVITRR